MVKPTEVNTYIEDRDPGDEDPKQFMLMEMERCAIDPDYFMARYGYLKSDAGFQKAVETNGPELVYKSRQRGFERYRADDLMMKLVFQKPAEPNDMN